MDLLEVFHSMDKFIKGKNVSKKRKKGGVANKIPKEKVLKLNDSNKEDDKGINYAIENSRKDPVIEENYALISEIEIKDEAIDKSDLKFAENIPVDVGEIIGKNNIQKVIEYLNNDLDKLSEPACHVNNINEETVEIQNNQSAMSHPANKNKDLSINKNKKNCKTKSNNTNVESCSEKIAEIASSTTAVQTKDVLGDKKSSKVKVNNDDFAGLIKFYCNKCDKTYKISETKQSKDGKSKENLTHCLDCKTSLLYQCSKCKTDAKFYVSIYEHVLTVCKNETAITPHLCRKCGRGFKLMKSAKKHEHKCFHKYKCSSCAYESFYFQNYTRHIEGCQRGSKGKTDMPDNNSSNKEKRNSTSVRHPHFFTCAHCCKKFKHENILSRHLHDHHFNEVEDSAKHAPRCDKSKIKCKNCYFSSVSEKDKEELSEKVSTTSVNKPREETLSMIQIYCPRCKDIEYDVKTDAKKCGKCKISYRYRCLVCTLKDFPTLSYLKSHIQITHLYLVSENST